LMHVIGSKNEPQKEDVKLQNGTTVTANGSVMNADGSKAMLANGQCIDLMGKIGDCEKMDKKADDKMMEKKPADAK
ncbi:MAG: DUF6799 domain-containing protein, partial [Bacteroidota bacterium]